MKKISKETCKELLIKAFSFFPSENEKKRQNLDLQQLSLSDFDSLATYIDETIGVSTTGKSLKALLTGAGAKNSTVNVVCAFLLVKKGVIQGTDLKFEEHVSDNRYYVRRYFENTSTEDSKKDPIQTNAILSEINIETKLVNKSYFKRSNLYVLMGILFLSFIAFGIYGSLEEEVAFPDFQVLVEDKSDRFPKEIKVTYDLKSEKFLRNSRISFMATPILLDELKGEVNLVASTPNLYTISLYANRVAYGVKRVLLTSNGWAGYTGDIPLAKRDWLTNGVMHLKDVDMAQKTSNGDYYTNFSIFKNFNVSGDSFELQADIKNPAVEGSPWAYDISVDVIGFENPVTFNFLSPDAIQYANMVVGDTDFKVGEKHKALQKLGVVFPEWQHLTVSCRNKKINIMLDGQTIVNEPYEGNIGQIVGLQFLFKGLGYAKNVKLDGRSI